MGSRDWFRSTTWNSEVKASFHERLARARRANRPQYLRIQASYLADAGLIEPALELLEQFLAEYPDDLQTSQALLQVARCLVEQSKIDEAISTMRSGLAVEARGSCKTGLWIELPWLIFEQGLSERSKLAQEAIRQGKTAGLDLFPIDRFKAHVVSAWIAESVGAIDVASAEAKAALASIQQNHSGFPYHPRAGLVDQPSAEGLLPWLEALAQHCGEDPSPH